jgi:hypothetical protein
MFCSIGGDRGMSVWYSVVGVKAGNTWLVVHVVNERLGWESMMMMEWRVCRQVGRDNWRWLTSGWPAVQFRFGAPKQLHKQGLAAQSSQDTIGAVKADRGDSENSK